MGCVVGRKEWDTTEHLNNNKKKKGRKDIIDISITMELVRNADPPGPTPNLQNKKFRGWGW